MEETLSRSLKRKGSSAELESNTPGGGGGGVLLGILGSPFAQILTQFQTKTCYFPHPFSDLTTKFQTRFQAFGLP